MHKILAIGALLIGLSGCFSAAEKLTWPDRGDEKWTVIGNE